MNNYYPGHSFVMLCSAILATSVCLALWPASLGPVLICWAFVSLGTLLRILGVTIGANDQAMQKKPVENLLKGLYKQKKVQEQHAVQYGLKTSLLLLMGFIALSAVMLFWKNGVEAIESIACLFLAGLVFWHVQGTAMNAVKASLMGTILASVLCVQIAFFHSLSVNPHDLLGASSENILLFAAGGFLAVIYVRGLFVRHRHHFFPAIGLFLLAFLCLTFFDLRAATMPVFVGLLAVCFAQSFPTARPEFHSYIHRPQLYT